MKKGKLRGALIRALGGYETQQSDLGPLFSGPALHSTETLKFHKIQSVATIRSIGEMSVNDILPVAQAKATEALFERLDCFSPAISFQNSFDYEAQTCTVTATIFVGYKELTP